MIDAAGGAITPVPVERAVERALEPEGLVTAGRVAAVGVGPAGCQQLVVVIERPDDVAGPRRSRTRRRGAGGASTEPVAAVLVAREVPVDIRHNAKIDRAAVADWAAETLA